MQPKFQTNYNREQFPKPKEKNSGISKTVPDQSMSIREIMLKHSRGIPMETKIPKYHEETEIETALGISADKLDISEIHEIMKEATESHEKYLSTLKAKQDEETKSAKAKAEQQLRAKWEQELMEQQKPESKNKS